MYNWAIHNPQEPNLMHLRATQFEAQEWSYTSSKAYADPFNEIELDVLLSHASGQTWRVPAFWGGGGEWRVRFAPPLPGRYRAVSVCSDPDNPALHAQSIDLEAELYTGDHPLLRHGPLQVAADRTTLAFADGTPFFWLGDTWWMGLCSRLRWPEEFQSLAADRVAKGFTLVQIVAGLYPDMPAFDRRGANEAGYPWEDGFARLNPAYFDMADLRIRWLARQGLVPCIVGCWGYYLPLLGIEKMKQHWRNLVARWAAYPVIWCLAGEAAMPYYLSEDKTGDAQAQMAGWTELARYLRQLDPHHRLVTIHPTEIGRDQLLDDSLLDIDMLQTGHGGYKSVPNAIAKVQQEVRRTPAMPVVIGEANYEGILNGSGAEIQRLTAWTTLLSGAAGFTYGANGLWQLNTRAQPYGPSPHGASWGHTPWEEAYRLPGSAHLGLAKRLLQRYDWPRFEPHPEWVSPCGGPGDIERPFAAGIPGQVRVIYFFAPSFPWSAQPLQVCQLESAPLRYRAFFWDPRSGLEYDLGTVAAGADGTWTIPVQPEMKDWVLVLESDRP
jgi:hypothetical protein